MPTSTMKNKSSFIEQPASLLGALICAIAGVFYCYEFILRIIPGVLEQELAAAFGNISAYAFGQIAALYYFAYSPMQFPVGMLMDRFGPKRMLSFACLCCTLGSLLFAQSDQLMLAGLGRLAVGFGSSFAFVGVLSLTLHWLPPRYFSLVAGLITSFSMFGLMYGEMKITYLASSLGLNAVLMILVLVGAVLSVLILLVVRDGPGGQQSKSLPLKEFFHNVRLVLLSPQVWLAGFVGACLYTSLSVFGELWGKTYLEQAHHLSKYESAAGISLLFLGWAAGAPLAGYLSDRSGRRILPLVVCALLSFVCISLILYYPGLSHFSLNLLLFLYGLFSGAEILVFVMAKENSLAQLSSTVFAATNMIVSLAGAILQPMVGRLLDLVGDSQVLDGVHVYSRVDYQLALSLIPISLLLVLIAAFFLKEERALNQTALATPE